MKILLVRLSALGDIIHTLPAITDLRKTYPYAQIDIAVDERFIDIPRLHPGIDHVLALPLKRWKRSWRSCDSLRELLAGLSELRAEYYDLVIDMHGLIKSATVTALAHGAEKIGFGRRHCSEWLAPLAYRRHFSTVEIPSRVALMRGLVAFAQGTAVSGPIDYGLRYRWQGENSRQVAFISICSSKERLWPEASWVELGRKLITAGYEPLLPWGSPEEEARVHRIGKAIGLGRCTIGKRQSIADWAQQLATCRMVIGLDTGLTHLAAAAGVPCLGLFVTTGACLLIPQTGTLAQTLGGDGVSPDLDAVCKTALEMLTKS